jgi:hypothetical protein
MDSKAQTLSDGRGDESRVPSSAPSILKEHQHSDSDAASTVGTLPVNNVSDTEKAEGGVPAEPDNAEYPTGFKMAAIVVALVLSIFLVSRLCCFFLGGLV